MAKARPKQKESGKTSITIPEGVSEFYANSLNVLITPWDFVLLYGSIVLPASMPIQSEAGGEVRVDAAIRMSPQHAKAAATVLKNMVEAHEAEFGEIPVVIKEKESETEIKQLDSGDGAGSD